METKKEAQIEMARKLIKSDLSEDLKELLYKQFPEILESNANEK